MSIEFSGLDELLNSLDELADKRELKKALGKACALVERTAKQKAPKGDGGLRRSITSKVEEDSGIIDMTSLSEMSNIEKKKLISNLERQMKEAAKNLDFEQAMSLRDIIFELKASL